MRNFVQSHPEYNHDSAVSEKIVYDLFAAVREIEKTEGKKKQMGWEMLSARERQKGRDD